MTHLLAATWPDAIESIAVAAAVAVCVWSVCRYVFYAMLGGE